jgi:hypothetical protein
MEEKSAFEEFETQGNVRRRSLLPLWIKIFLWFFLIGGSFAVIFLMIAPFLSNISLSLYGINASHPYTLPGIIVTFCLYSKELLPTDFGLNRNGLHKLQLLTPLLALEYVLS